MDESLEDAIDAGLGDLGFLIYVFESDCGVVLLEKLEDVQCLGKDGNQVEALDFCLRQPFGSETNFIERQVSY